MFAKIICILTLSFLCFPLLLAQVSDFSEQAIVFSPTLFSVGDEVRMRISLRERQNLQVTEAFIRVQPEWGWVEVESVTQKEGAVELILEFIAYEPGTLTIPPILFGDRVLSSLSFTVPSIFELEPSVQETFYGLLPPLSMPYTSLFSVLFFLFVLGLPFLGFILLRTISSFFRKFSLRYQIRRPFRVFKKKLAKLNQGHLTMSEREFYIYLTDTMRDYLTHRISPLFLSATTQEISLILAQFDFSDTIKRDIQTIFHSADMIKYAKIQSYGSERENQLERALSLGHLIHGSFHDYH